jgi:superfamily II DNA or RNA helicase
MIELGVKLIRFNKGKPDEYVTPKCVLNKTELQSLLPEEDFKSLIRFIMQDNICIEERFNGMKDTYNPHIIIGNNIIMPRFMFQRLENYFADNNMEYRVSHTSHISDEKLLAKSARKFGNLKISLYANKIAVIDRIVTMLRAQYGLIVKLDTGKGKSVIIAEVIRKMGLLTNIVTKDSTLQRQMFKDLHATLELDCTDCVGECMTKSGLSKCKYIALLGGTKGVSNTRLLDSGKYKILISIINSAKDKDFMFWSKFGLTIFDECHNYTSDVNGLIYQRSQTKYMLGLSATPDKRWNHMMLEHNIGEIVDFDPYIQSGIQLKGEVRKINYRGPPQYTQSLKNVNGVMSVAKMVKQFMEDEQRNQMIINTIISAVAEHKFGFVFAMRNDFLDKLKSLLDEAAPEITSMILSSETSVADKEITIKNVNVIFTNFSFSEGLNITHMRFLLTASPYKGNGRQITGRLLRDLKDETRYFYDIVDVNTKLSQQFQERELVYLKRGFNIVEYCTEQNRIKKANSEIDHVSNLIN